MTMILYMAVTPDEYELPLCVAESPDELGQMIGRSGKYVMEAIAKHRRAPPKYAPKLIRIGYKEKAACAQCGTEFERVSRKQMYCSKGCAHRARNKRRMEKQHEGKQSDR